MNWFLSVISIVTTGWLALRRIDRWMSREYHQNFDSTSVCAGAPSEAKSSWFSNPGNVSTVLENLRMDFTWFWTKCDQEVRPVDFSPRLNLEGGANANNRSDDTVYYRKTEHLRWLDDYFDFLDYFLYVVLGANCSSYGTFSFLRETTKDN